MLELDSGIVVRVVVPDLFPAVQAAPPDFAPAVGVLPVIGPKGDPGNTLTVIAAVVLPGHRVVALTPAGAVLADPGDPAHTWAAVAITLGAALAGQPAQVADAGILTEPSWAWTPQQPVFAGPAGVLTQTPATTGWLRVVGVATAPTSLWLAFTRPIRLTP